jgi:iron complex outermembrane recepter protein
MTGAREAGVHEAGSLQHSKHHPRNPSMAFKLTTLAASLALVGLAGGAFAQTAGERVTITGSSIKRIAAEGALPVQVITRQELAAQGIASAEQLISQLNINGNGLDNLAGNADVVDGAARGNNGATSANLRGQGSNATLVLLNGRRIASHGLNGGTVDLNQIPFSAIERVEILKDGASAIYGTDAIGGVINFILRNNYKGLQVGALVDIPQEEGGQIYGANLTAGFGDLESQGFNFLASLSVRDHKALRGDQRDFVNTYQPNRGISPDTRGAPIATVFAIGSLYSAISRDNINATGRGTGPVDFADPSLRVNGINVLDLPGGAGCSSVDGMNPYREDIWAAASSKYGCDWDTGRAAVIQQPVRNTNLVSRLSFKLGEHVLAAEAVLGKSESAKSFSNNQISSTTLTTTLLPDGVTRVPHPFLNLAYPSTAPGYLAVFNQLAAAFPAVEANRALALPLAFRWRCMPCGPRELETETDTSRFLLSAEGPLFANWEYRVGVSQAKSESKSTLGSGYHYWQPFADLINNGVLNPFSLTQTPDALARLNAISARGVTLYGGEFSMTQTDAQVSGPLFKLPAGQVMAAIGIDRRTESYKFDGDQRPNANTVGALVFNAPFDNALATAGTLERDINAVYAEVQIPILKTLEVTLAARSDDYTGFGRSSNPKATVRWAPIEAFMVRGAYSTGFRVPTFKQQFDPVTVSTYTGADYTDPATCPTRTVNPAVAGCAAITPGIIFGGKSDLEPEEAEMGSVGIVFQPHPSVSGNIDYWEVKREGTIQSLGLTTLSTAQNYPFFIDRFVRDGTGRLVGVDTRWVNAGQTITRGLEFGIKAGTSLGAGRIGFSLDVSYLLDKKSKVVKSAREFGPSEVGVFTRAGDLGVRWKHTASTTYQRGDWSGTLTQVYRGGYADFVLPGVRNGTIRPALWEQNVRPYEVFNFSATYRGVKNLVLTAGIKNLLNEDPPFSVNYDTNTGAGSSWEPRVADPRGRAFTLRAEYTFF